MTDETDTTFGLKPKMFSTALDRKCVLKKGKVMNGQWKRQSGLELVDKSDLMQVPVLHLSCPLEQAVRWRNYTGTFFTEFAKVVTVSLLYSFNAISISRIQYSVYMLYAFTCS